MSVLSSPGPVMYTMLPCSVLHQLGNMNQELMMLHVYVKNQLNFLKSLIDLNFDCCPLADV